MLFFIQMQHESSHGGTQSVFLRIPLRTKAAAEGADRRKRCSAR